MNEHYHAMRNTVSMLGTLLGETIAQAQGDDILVRVETIRQLSKSSRAGNKADRKQLLSTLQQLSDDELLPVARAFNQFLNLTNTAEQYHSIYGEAASHPQSLVQLFKRLKKNKVSDDALRAAVEELSIELVLTAHPTEITRRTLIHKLVEVNTCLSQLDHQDLRAEQRNNIMQRLRQLIAQSWYTDEIRQQRPTPIDEAKWGFAVIENSLWEAVPVFLRELNTQLEKALHFSLPPDRVPVRFISWMGGDRDGNPNVTAAVTQHALLLGRWKACDLFLRDIRVLVSELSMSQCTPELSALAGGEDIAEPYRQILKKLRTQFIETQSYLNNLIKNEHALPPRNLLLTNEQLWQPLYACWQSLNACGMGLIANGALLDTLYRIRCFGIFLVRLDVRQETTRHTRALAELIQYLDLGDYDRWSEAEKQLFLLRELNTRRPLLPQSWDCTADTREVIETCKVIAAAPPGSIAAYAISMARAPSDVLAVHLLLKAVGCPLTLPVVPLFETLDDLNNSSAVMTQLFTLDGYRELIQDRQMVMIGYSDSAKDAGVMAASWAQYRAQEALIKICEQMGIRLTLFHGRGGSVGRGGAPAHAALLSQPPGSLKGGFRVTEQGEMIRFKFGLPEVSVNSLMLYAGAILEANLLPPPEPEKVWRELMDMISVASCKMYRHYIREHPDFIPYFRSATPQQELAKLPLGSRPAKRHSDGGVESLRAIPWIFSWTQNRLMLPAWLGAGHGLQKVIDAGKQQQLAAMCRDWPFFATRIGMLEMVFAKADMWLAEYYDQRLVEEKLWPLGSELRAQLAADIRVVLGIAHGDQLMADLPWIAESIQLRNIYTDPLNVLQAELLWRSRQQEKLAPEVEQALMITIAGIAAGMRNTG